MDKHSLYDKYPDHKVELKPSTEHVRVRFAGAVIADSTRTLVVHESRHEPVTYFPRDDVNLEHLERTEHQTFCGFKGDASYWSLRVGDEHSENSVWTYESPFPQVADLRDYVAFYADRVEWERS